MGELDRKGSKSYLLFLGLAVGFILIMALLNFINLSTARVGIRAKEIGVRKTVEAQKQQLIQQFLIESGLIVLAAFFLAILLLIAILPRFNQLIDLQLQIEALFSVQALMIGLASGLLISLIAGLYPAFFLSSSSYTGLW